MTYVSTRTFQPVESRDGELTFQMDATDSLEQFVHFPFRLNGQPIQPGVIDELPSYEQKSAAIDILSKMNPAEIRDMAEYNKRGQAMDPAELARKRRNVRTMPPENDPDAWWTET